MGTTHTAGVAGAIAGLVAGTLGAGFIALTPLPAAYPDIVPQLVELAALGSGFAGAAIGIRLSRPANRAAFLRALRRTVPRDHRLWAVFAGSSCVPLIWVIHFLGVFRGAWLDPTPDRLLRALVAVAVVPTAAWAAGWVACLLAAEIGIGFVLPLVEPDAEEFEDPTLPPFLTPVPADPPNSRPLID